MLVARASGAKIVIGFETKPFGEVWDEALFDVTVPYPRDLIHESDIHLALIRALGIKNTSARPEFFLTQADVSFADSFVERLPKHRLCVAVSPSQWVRRSDRGWSEGNLAALLDRLIREKEALLVLVGAEGDEDLFNHLFVSKQGWTSGICHFLCEPRWARVAAVIKRMDLFLTPDGGNLHLAAAVGAKVLTIFRSADPARWCPKEVDIHLLEGGDGPLSVETVFNNIVRLTQVDRKTPS